MPKPANVSRAIIVVASTLFAGLAAVSVVSCSHKLTDEDCNHLLGRAIGLAAFSGSAEVPVDVDALRKRARGAPKQAITDFDKACLGSSDDGATACARRANDVAQFEGCGGLVKKARDTGLVAKQLVARKHDADECAKYGEHAAKIGVVAFTEAGKAVQDCDAPMELGVYDCRLVAKDAAAWDACADLPSDSY
jgi:hypothetical protein